MRNLNLEELEDKILDYSSTIKYVDSKLVNDKLNQFFNFLYDQPISKSILSRIEEDYSHIKSLYPTDTSRNWPTQKHTFISSPKLPDEFGALGLFLLKPIYKKVDNYNTEYLDLPSRWFENNSSFAERQEEFNEQIFNPFIELIEWYIYESKSRNSSHYFSKAEINGVDEKLEQLLSDVRLGQEVVFNEIEELRNEMKSLNKKNWGQLLKGKLMDLTMSKVLTFEVARLIFQTITGEELPKLIQ